MTGESLLIEQSLSVKSRVKEKTGEDQSKETRPLSLTVVLLVIMTDSNTTHDTERMDQRCRHTYAWERVTVLTLQLHSNSILQVIAILTK